MDDVADSSLRGRSREKHKEYKRKPIDIQGQHSLSISEGLSHMRKRDQSLAVLKSRELKPDQL